MTDPTALSATALSAAIQSGELTAEAVMVAYLKRIHALNPKINAIVSLRPEDELLAEARVADRERAAGRSRGWLHGMPIAIKDLSEVAGIVCSYGYVTYVGLLTKLPILGVLVRSQGEGK